MPDDASGDLDASVDSTRTLPRSTPANLTGGPERRLSPGDILGGRFTVIRFLARGGMGEVYEVADTHLQNKHFALKTLRSEIVGDPTGRQRFEREVLMAREVTHPNVCQTFDVFHVAGPRGPVMFLVMKLLRGESLASRLKRAGPFDPQSALPLVRQIADALAAAHRAGVIHRDFKPGNVMLESISGETRVAVTDFGLSSVYKADESLTEASRVCGTRGYIAPELFEGATAGPASDVYAFGVVVHEMLTGQTPGSENNGRFLPPSAYIKDLPRAWDRLVMGSLESDPARRFQSIGEAMAALEPKDASSQWSRRRVPPARARIYAVIAAAAALLIPSAWFGLPAIDSLLHPLPRQRFVALMAWPADTQNVHRPLLNNVLDTTASWLRRSESSVKDLLIISPSDVSAGTSLDTPKDAVGKLGANLVLTANMRSTGNGVTLAFEVMEAATQKVLRRKELTATDSELGRLPERAAMTAAQLLDVSSPAHGMRDQDELAAVPPAAYRLYTSAEDLATQPNDVGLDGAIEKYQRALDIDPRFALAYARISMAFIRKFVRSQDSALLDLAARNAKSATQYNPDSADSFLAQAMVDVNSGRAQQALRELSEARQRDPGNPQILIIKARTLRDLDRGAEEEDVYRDILKQRPNYWPAYLELGQTLYRHGDYPGAAQTFKEGSAVAPHVAILFTNLGSMYLLMDRKAEAESALRRSIQLEPTEFAYSNLGSLAFAAGDYRKALSLYQKARDLRPTRDTTWRNIGDCYAMLGDPARVKESYRKAEELLAGALQINPNPGNSWMSLAFYQAKIGMREEAETSLHNAEARGASDVQSQFKKAQVLALLGNYEAALQQVLNCLANGLSHTQVDLALDLAAVRNDPRYQRQVARITHKP